jgi:hypothetical protein
MGEQDVSPWKANPLISKNLCMAGFFYLGYTVFGVLTKENVREQFRINFFVRRAIMKQRQKNALSRTIQILLKAVAEAFTTVVITRLLAWIIGWVSSP